MARLLLVVAAALILCGVASAATIDDLSAAGYTVTISNPGQNGCPIYAYSGHGTNGYFTCNDQAIIDALANPVTICNDDWQMNHGDQYNAYNSLSRKGWGISGDQCADRYTVTNPNDNTTAYSGPGQGLVGFDSANAGPPAAQTTTTPGQTPVAVAPPQNCLPLCPQPGDQRGAGGVLIPAIIVGTTAALSPNASFAYDAVTGEVASTRLMLRVGRAVAV